MATIAAGSAATLPAVMAGLIKALRPKQGTKNALVLFALAFTINKWWTPEDVLGMLALAGTAAAALGLFVLLSGGVYIVNDLFDIEADRAHPRKRHRPIASGALPVRAAWPAALFLLGLSLSFSFVINTAFGFIALAYLLLMLTYNAKLKYVVLLDVMTIAAGFVLRAAAGAAAIDQFALGHADGRIVLDLTVSPWLYICTGLGALFIALAKRRGELVQAGDRSADQRAILGDYSIGFLDQLIAIVAPATLVTYALYTFSGSIGATSNVPVNNSMMLTVPFVAYGLFRYLYLIHRHGKGEMPEEVLITDRPLLINIFLWLGAAAVILFLNR